VRAIRVLFIFGVIAVGANVVLVTALPQVVNAYIRHRIAEAAGGVNTALPAPRADATARTVVRPSPDLLYTACAFDIRHHPLRVTGPVPDSYASVAGFADDTTNFFAINDADVVADADGRKRFDLVIALDDAEAVPAGVTRVVATSPTGVILFRSLIVSEAALPRLLEVQKQQSCAPL
jgi:uncharacterized membrane protein